MVSIHFPQNWVSCRQYRASTWISPPQPLTLTLLPSHWWQSSSSFYTASIYFDSIIYTSNILCVYIKPMVLKWKKTCKICWPDWVHFKMYMAIAEEQCYFPTCLLRNSGQTNDWLSVRPEPLKMLEADITTDEEFLQSPGLLYWWDPQQRAANPLTRQRAEWERMFTNHIWQNIHI